MTLLEQVPPNQKASPFRLFAFSFLILFFELALIRFIPANVRVAAYFINLVLIAAFLGMGSGLILQMRKRQATFLFMPFLLILMATCHYFANIIVEVPMGGEEGFFVIYSDMAPGSKSWGMVPVLSLLFILIAATFIPLGLAMGHEFALFPALKAYCINIAGSIAGIAMFALMSGLETSPLIWFGFGGTLFLLLSRSRREWITSTLTFAPVLYLVFSLALPQGEIWSPYYRINVFEKDPREQIRSIHVNGSFHQNLIDFSEDSVKRSPAIRQIRKDYLRPYKLAESLDEVLILGAGTGNDLTMALSQNPGHVDAVEIDPEILKIGKQLNPHRPYDDPRVTVYVEDARAFLKQSTKKYDLVVLGTLDSQTLLSGMSSLRLDNYVYTVESFISIKEHLKPGGKLILYHSSVQPHIIRKLYFALQKAFGSPPLWRFQHPFFLFNSTFVAGNKLDPHPDFPDRFEQHGPDEPEMPIPTDDWPYLYLVHPSISGHYLIMGGVIALFSIILVIGVMGRKHLGRPDGPLFFLGAGFLLLETKSVTEMSLMFGSTWLVNILVFVSILLLILAANLVILRFPKFSPQPLFIGLFIAIMLGYFTPVHSLVGLSLQWRWLLGGLLLALPLFFAGMIFASLLKTRTQPVLSLGFNLIGSILGGLMEYSSMAYGTKSLYLFSGAMYLLAFLMMQREKQNA